MKRFTSIFLTISIILFLFVGCVKTNPKKATTQNITSKVQELLTVANSKEAKVETITDGKTFVDVVGES